MNDDFFFHEKSTITVIIHETFLVLRILSMGLAVIISVSLIIYLRLVAMDGPLLLFKPSEES